MKKTLDLFVANWGLFFLGASTAILGAAYFFQFVLGYQPCELCLYQRYPYMIIAVVALIAYVTRHRHDIGLKRAARGFLIIIIMLLFLEVFLAAHHIGVEQGFWQAFTACAGIDIDPSATTEEYLRLLSEIQVLEFSIDLHETAANPLVERCYKLIHDLLASGKLTGNGFPVLVKPAPGPCPKRPLGLQHLPGPLTT